MPPAALLTIDGLTKRFGAFAALDDVSLGVQQGEILGLIGPNGAGKTTLFECVAGIQPIDGGAVRGQSGAWDDAVRKRTLFYMPDGVRPWPDQEVGWALRFARAMFGTSRSSTVDAVTSSLDIVHLLGQRMHELSKGEHKRVLLACALLSSAPLLMLDEPFDGLDLRQTREVMRVLRDEAGRGRTLFLSIHQLTDAARVCTRFVLLSGGRRVAEGTLAELTAGVAQLGAGASLEDVFLALT